MYLSGKHPGRFFSAGLSIISELHYLLNYIVVMPVEVSQSNNKKHRLFPARYSYIQQKYQTLSN